jgi:hypothetical protein
VFDWNLFPWPAALLGTAAMLAPDLAFGWRRLVRGGLAERVGYVAAAVICRLLQGVTLTWAVLLLGGGLPWHRGTLAGLALGCSFSGGAILADRNQRGELVRASLVGILQQALTPALAGTVIAILIGEIPDIDSVVRR